MPSTPLSLYPNHLITHLSGTGPGRVFRSPSKFSTSLGFFFSYSRNKFLLEAEKIIMPLFSFLSENQRQKLGFYKMSLMGPEGKEREWTHREPTSSGLFLCPCKTKARLMPSQLPSLPHKSSRSRHPPPRVSPPQYFFPPPRPGTPTERAAFLANSSGQASQSAKNFRVRKDLQSHLPIKRKKTASELQTSKEPASVSAQMA